ncbi:hypothetical protein HHI36_023472 [Cryptolaemus montrouzieri]|uniref:Uncharacterized protein n=1 Tax=Cryptolaemus montrouzieri TaxID=559131 RepID=A0ABD2PGF6_9CUCU
MQLITALMIKINQSQVLHTANNEDPGNDLKRRHYLKKIAFDSLDPHLKLRATETNVPEAVQQRMQEVDGTSANTDQKLEMPVNIKEYCAKMKIDQDITAKIAKNVYV